ncbi:helix-turn-helix domain-containing protein [Deinococcus ficus]|uniref:helix-turn-helix domain-containing protein n=1 Tax=Deinococcus ficus TaxID=317577 RepID=UPI0003F9396A|nr:helix-turn-helix transcriptional regulator [Deinococcus ficus]
MIGNVVGDRVREARVQKNMTLHELHQRIQEQSGIVLSQPTLTRIERRQRSVFDFEIIALVRALEVDARWLLGLIELDGTEVVDSQR